MEGNIAELKNKGMLKDCSISKSSDEYVFENMNIRITPNQDNTGLSITNEKGPLLCVSDITRSLLINQISLSLKDEKLIFTLTNPAASELTVRVGGDKYVLSGIAVGSTLSQSTIGIFNLSDKSNKSGYTQFTNASGIQFDSDSAIYDVYIEGESINYVSTKTKLTSDIDGLYIKYVILKDRSGNQSYVDVYNHNDNIVYEDIIIPSGKSEYVIDYDKSTLRDYTLKDGNDYVYDSTYIYMLKDTYDKYISEKKQLPSVTVNLPSGIIGEYCGSCQIPNRLVVFTHIASTDRIYLIGYKGVNELSVKLLYTGNLNLDVDHKVEALYHFESEDIQKVYWVDGVNQPRVINIADSNLAGKDSAQFDFIASVDKLPRIDIKKDYNSTGLFPAGTIQYGVSYYNKFGSETKLLWFSSVHYITYSDRAAKADEVVTCSFVLKILNLDKKFDYVRVYSAIRTSLDSDVTVSIVGDYAIKNRSTITVYDTNSNHTALDPALLNYIGGSEFIAETISAKNDRMFFGGIKLLDNNNTTALRNTIKSLINYTAVNKGLVINNAKTISFGYKSIGMETKSTLYPYKPQTLCSRKHFTYFKYGEIYRFAIQFQTKTGAWTNPLWIGDKKCFLRPKTDLLNSRLELPTAIFTWDNKLNEVTKDYVKYRILTAETSSSTRNVVAQGVLNPTVFSLKDRINNSPYSVPSWIMRPKGDVTSSLGESTSDEIQSMDAEAVPYYNRDEYLADSSKESGTVVGLMFTRRIDIVKKYWAKNGADTNISKLQHFLLRYALPLLSGVGIADLLSYKYCLIISYTYIGDKIDDDSVAIHCESRTNRNVMWSKVKSWIKSNLNTDISKDLTKKEFKHLCNLNYDNSITNWVRDLDESDTSLSYLKDLGFGNETKSPLGKNAVCIYRKLYTKSALNQNTSYSNDILNNGYFIDDSVLTFNSPEIEANQDLINNSNLNMRIIGYIPITGGSSGVELDVDTSGITSAASKKDTDENYAVANISDSFRTLTSDLLYEDSGWFTNGDSDNERLYPSLNLDPYKIFMWHKSGSINGTNSKTWDSIDGKAFDWVPSNLKHKIFANKRFSMYNVFFDKPANINITAPVVVYDDNTTTVIKGCDGDIYYQGFVDSLITRKAATTRAYVKNVNNGYDVQYQKRDDAEVYVSSYDPVRIKYKTTSHVLLAMTDGKMTYYRLPNMGVSPSDPLTDGMSFPWIQPAWTIDDDYVFAGLFKSVASAKAKLTSATTILSQNKDKVIVIAIPHVNLSKYSKYYIVEMVGGAVSVREPVIDNTDSDDNDVNEDIIDIPMSVLGGIEWDYGRPVNSETVKFDSFYNIEWRKAGETVTYKQLDFSDKPTTEYPYLYLAELYREIPYESLYGGYEDTQIENIDWVISSSPTDIKYDINTMGGDTYYQRWDCLKTYPYTEEDINSVVDITSFMVESHLNLDGRCDINRRNIKTTVARPTNYNLFNTVYNQTDNLFRFKSLDEKYDLNKFANQIVWSNAKIDTDEIDSWTNVNMLSSLSLDGAFGDITRLYNFNDTLLAFQDMAISVINYNNPTQISTESGSPIEVTNSGVVNGYTKLSDSYGCQYKWSICKGGAGLYFIDNLKKAMLSFSKEGLQLISAKGFSQWFKDNLDINSEVNIYYDAITHDTYVSNDDFCLSYNEDLQAFTSFYSYEGIKLVFNINGESYMIGPDKTTTMYAMFAGDYGYVFNHTQAPYYIIYKANPEPMFDKIFTNIEYTADIIDDKVDEVNYKKGYPFKQLDIWNEYQKGSVDLTKQRNVLQYDNARKFRVWRTQLPRDEMSKNKLDRIRNTWAYIKLSNNNPLGEKVVLHNVILKYYK